jgi:hypothetical protein
MHLAIESPPTPESNIPIACDFLCWLGMLIALGLSWLEAIR